MHTSDEPLEDDNPFVGPPLIGPDEVAPDEDAPPPPEPDGEPAPEPGPQGPTEREIEARFRTVDRATKAYVRKLEEAFGADFEQFLGCPMCAADFPGYIHIGKVGGFPREIVAQTNEIMTGFKQVEYRQLPGFETCPTCDGEGKGFTGSKVPDKQYATCPACTGRGYLAPSTQQANGSAPAPVALEGAPEASGYVSGEDVDSWGEPRTLPDGRDNPNFGRMPQFKVLVDPYGITANLTATGA